MRPRLGRAGRCRVRMREAIRPIQVQLRLLSKVTAASCSSCSRESMVALALTALRSATYALARSAVMRIAAGV